MYIFTYIYIYVYIYIHIYNTCQGTLCPPKWCFRGWKYPPNVVRGSWEDEFFLSILLMGLRNPVNSAVEVGSLSHYLPGFRHPKWLFGISSINSKEDILFSLRNLPPTYTPRKFDRQLAPEK